MNGDEHFRDKTIDELLAALNTDAQVNSKVWEQLRMAVVARSAQEVAGSIRDYTESNRVLSGRLLWLNIVLGIFTIVGTILAVWSLVAAGRT